MKYIKKFNSNINEEFFGGDPKVNTDQKIDAIISKLTAIKNNKWCDSDSGDSVQHVYDYIVGGNDLDMIAKSKRTSQRVKGRGETISQRVKRSVDNF